MILVPLFRLGNWIIRTLPPRLRHPVAALTGRCGFYLKGSSTSTEPSPAARVPSW